jgi:hypothetical protein
MKAHVSDGTSITDSLICRGQYNLLSGSVCETSLILVQVQLNAAFRNRLQSTI